MKIIYFSIVAGLLATAASAWQAITQSDERTAELAQEAFKACLAFSLLAAAGAVLKTTAESFVEAEREKRARAAERERRRREILSEFCLIYSEFYSLRKLWHSARSKSKEVFGDEDSEQYRSLVRRLVESSVTLEGRFGALKIEAISHFGLRSGDFQTKRIPDLQRELESTECGSERARLLLDLVGEQYDDWRHALEEQRKIRPGDELWTAYEELLRFFEAASIT